MSIEISVYKPGTMVKWDAGDIALGDRMHLIRERRPFGPSRSDAYSLLDLYGPSEAFFEHCVIIAFAENKCVAGVKGDTLDDILLDVGRVCDAHDSHDARVLV